VAVEAILVQQRATYLDPLFNHSNIGSDVTMETKICSLLQLNTVTDTVSLNNARKLSELQIFFPDLPVIYFVLIYNIRV
jgi:hypothetical protein